MPLLLTGETMPTRMMPGFLGATALVPSATDPNTASARLPPLVSDGMSDL